MAPDPAQCHEVLIVGVSRYRLGSNAMSIDIAMAVVAVQTTVQLTDIDDGIEPASLNK
jgi:hypothetical protein